MGVTQIIAEELGVPPEDVIVMMPDTDSAGYDAGSQGSRTTHIVGRAATKAAAEVRERSCPSPRNSWRRRWKTWSW